MGIHALINISSTLSATVRVISATIFFLCVVLLFRLIFWTQKLNLATSAYVGKIFSESCLGNPKTPVGLNFFKFYFTSHHRLKSATQKLPQLLYISTLSLYSRFAIIKILNYTFLWFILKLEINLFLGNIIWTKKIKHWNKNYLPEEL